MYKTDQRLRYRDSRRCGNTGNYHDFFVQERRNKT
nr:MAG TPA: hypothetical protein [Caudoviricetes sp.]